MNRYTSSQLAAEIGTIRLQLRNVLEGDWSSVLDQALQQASPHGRDRANWGFRVDIGAPLRFRQTMSSETGIPVKVDVSGTFLAPKNGRPIFDHSVVIRVWATDAADYFDKALDAPDLERMCIGRGRVVSRFLFCAVDSPNEPWFHLHFGGANREGHEYCRVPVALEVPRFVHHPVGLIQACEFVLFHFYPSAYEGISRDPTWQHWLHESEKAYMQAFVDDIVPLSRKWPIRSYLQHSCGVT